MRLAGAVAPADAVFRIQDRDTVRKRPAGLTGAGERVRQLTVPRRLGTLPTVQQREHFLPGARALRDSFGERARGPLAKQVEMANVVEEQASESHREQSPSPAEAEKEARPDREDREDQNGDCGS